MSNFVSDSSAGISSQARDVLSTEELLEGNVQLGIGFQPNAETNYSTNDQIHFSHTVCKAALP